MPPTRNVLRTVRLRYNPVRAGVRLLSRAGSTGISGAGSTGISGAGSMGISGAGSMGISGAGSTGISHGTEGVKEKEGLTGQSQTSTHLRTQNVVRTQNIQKSIFGPPFFRILIKTYQYI